MPEPDDLPPILWRHRGLYVALNAADWNRLPQAVKEELIEIATPKFKIFDRLAPKGSPPEFIPIELMRHAARGEVRLPQGGYLKYTELLRENCIESIRGWKSEATTMPINMAAARAHDPVPQDFQIEILEACSNGIKESGLSSGIIEAGMGGGKTLLGAALIFGLRDLRPAVICGWREKDTQQIYANLNDYLRANPMYHEQVILHLPTSGASLKEKQRAILEDGHGIMVCTQAGLQQAPLNAKLLIIDEYHNMATIKGIAKINRLRLLERCYCLSGTVGLRSDGGDKIMQLVTGPVLIRKKHAEIEKTGRVTPVNVNGYYFVSRGKSSLKNGFGRYYHDPARPERSPNGRDEEHALIENHSGRSRFICDLTRWLPKKEVKVIFTPHVQHAALLERFMRYECKGYDPVLIHSQDDSTKPNYLPKEEKIRRREALMRGEIELAICTDVLSTGVNTNVIDHTIDTTGKLQLITSIQRSGRSVRPRTKADGSDKVAQIHVIIDRNFEEMSEWVDGMKPLLDPAEDIMKEAYRLLGDRTEGKFKALLKYYGYGPAKVFVTQPDQPGQLELVSTSSERRGGGIIYAVPPWITEQTFRL